MSPIFKGPLHQRLRLSEKLTLSSGTKGDIFNKGFHKGRRLRI